MTHQVRFPGQRELFVQVIFLDLFDEEVFEVDQELEGLLICQTRVLDSHRHEVNFLFGLVDVLMVHQLPVSHELKQQKPPVEDGSQFLGIGSHFHKKHLIDSNLDESPQLIVVHKHVVVDQAFFEAEIIQPGYFLLYLVKISGPFLVAEVLQNVFFHCKVLHRKEVDQTVEETIQGVLEEDFLELELLLLDTERLALLVILPKLLKQLQGGGVYYLPKIGLFVENVIDFEKVHESLRHSLHLSIGLQENHRRVFQFLAKGEIETLIEDEIQMGLDEDVDGL